jgi:hypothetical protein
MVSTIVGLSILHGFVIMKLWAWFVLPTFTSAPPLHIATAIGISMLVTYITNEHPTHEENYWVVALTSPFFVLFFGWIIQHWV